MFKEHMSVLLFIKNDMQAKNSLRYGMEPRRGGMSCSTENSITSIRLKIVDFDTNDIEKKKKPCSLHN